MRQITRAELEAVAANREPGEWIDLTDTSFVGLDLSGIELNYADLKGADFRRTDLTGMNFRYSDLTGIHIEGANLFCANLEYAIVKEIHDDGETKCFRMHCPEKGPFVAYKNCFNYRVVQLLVPADAKRTSATNYTCRCNKAKVLSIKSVDASESFTEAHSYVDENFIYRVGEMAEVRNFNEDRWMDSTTGIHFFMTRAEAVAYM